MANRAKSKGFSGFPAGRLACTPVPNLFFSEVLPRLDSLAEVQVTLHALWLLYRKKGYPRYLTVRDLLDDTALVAGLRAAGGEPDQLLAEGLRRAVERGTLLRLVVERDGRTQELYFANGEHGRRAVATIQAGELDVGQALAEAPAGPPPERRDVYTLYEQNVGLLTPLIAEELAEAERLYPADWLEAAFRQAVAYNRRSWKYVQRILERWAVEGRQEDEETGRGAGRPGSATAYRRGRSGRTVYER